ncbi:MAG: HDOD domain-containing protein [Planctomycetales bacterium]|nr:HDOD domain-containing protein [Planctomycetales bacterium]
MPNTIQDIVRADHLPSLPQVALRIIELARDPEPDLDELARLIMADPALAGKILKTVNSALFGLRGKVTSIEKSLPKLGITLVRTLVLSFSLADERSDGREPQRALTKFWRTSLAQAVFAELLGHEIRGADPATYFLGGLIQDIGILAMLRAVPEEYEEHVMDISEYPCVTAAERRQFGFTHVDVGRRIWHDWGFSDSFIASLVSHHDTFEHRLAHSDAQLTAALQAASLGARYLESIHKPGLRQLDLLSCVLQERFNIEPADTQEIIQEACDRIGEMAATFSFDVGRGVPTARIVDDARQVLAEIALQTQLQAIAQAADDDSGPAAPGDANSHDEEIYGRHCVDHVFSEHIVKHLERREPLSLICLEIENLRQVTTEGGKEQGDLAIQTVVHVARQLKTDHDYLIRYGADDFLLAMTSLKPGDLEPFVARIRHDVKLASKPLERQLRLNIGAVLYQPSATDAADPNWLIEEVEQALYEARGAEGNHVCCYEFQGRLALVPAST